MITPSMLKLELDRLKTVLDSRIERTKEILTSRRKLTMDLIDTGFVKISDNKYSLDIRNYGQSYVTFIVTFRGKGVDIHEDHLIIVDRNEVPASDFGESFKLSSVRYSRVMEEIYNRVVSLSEEFSIEE
jgi:anaerobic ribonucleoside-triphosphate reductase